jgi:surface glycoprotein (TIGR04207 family)
MRKIPKFEVNIMKKIISVFLTVIMVLSVCAVSVSAAPTLSKSALTLAKGYQTTLKVTGTGQAVTWASDNTAVATVSGGKVVAKSLGTANITAKVSGYTLTCKVTVVATKITLSPEILTIGVGDTVRVTATVLGDKSGFSMSNSNSAVAKGKFVSPAKFVNNKIQFDVTGYRAGTASITLYRKNFRDTYFKAISVQVTDGEIGYNGDGDIKAVDTKVEMEDGSTAQISVWSSDPTNTTAFAYDSSVVKVERVGKNGNYVYFKLTALKAGSTVIKSYNNPDYTKYTEIPVKVNPKPKYYQIYETVSPTKQKSTDVILSFTNKSKNYYILVPYDYDEANTNSIIADYTKTYKYDTVYDKRPTKINSSDVIKTFTARVNNTSKTIYVLYPYGYEEADYNTTMALYTDTYDYYIIYNTSPKKLYKTDVIITWSVKNLKNNNTTVRYMLLPIDYDGEKANDIRSKDQLAHNDYAYYVVYSKYPQNIRTGERVYSWYKDNNSNQVRYLIAPSKGENFVLRNDVIRKENGYATYFTPYTDNGSIGTPDSVKETISIQSADVDGWSQRVYVLIDYTDPNWKTKLKNCLNGTFYTTKQGDFYGTTVYNN